MTIGPDTEEAAAHFRRAVAFVVQEPVMTKFGHHISHHLRVKTVANRCNLKLAQSPRPA